MEEIGSANSAFARWEGTLGEQATRPRRKRKSDRITMHSNASKLNSYKKMGRRRENLHARRERGRQIDFSRRKRLEQVSHKQREESHKGHVGKREKRMTFWTGKDKGVAETEGKLTDFIDALLSSSSITL